MPDERTALQGAAADDGHGRSDAVDATGALSPSPAGGAGGAPCTTGLNDDHRRVLRCAFRSIGECLEEALRIVDTPDASRWRPYCADTTPAQQAAVRVATEWLCVRMQQRLSEFGVAPIVPDCRASRAAASLVQRARIDLAELHPSRLRGYGPLTPAAERTLIEAVDELTAALARLEACLVAATANPSAEPVGHDP